MVLAKALACCKGRGAGIEPAGTQNGHDLEVSVGAQRGARATVVHGAQAPDELCRVRNIA